MKRRDYLEHVGETHGRLKIIGVIRKKIGTRTYAYFICECECKNIKEIKVANVLKGYTKSCGCIQKEYMKTTMRDNNIKHGRTNTKLHYVWRGIKRRCYNENTKEYENYGGRGISVCEIWKNDFNAFYDWSMENGYSEGLTIERKNNDGNYEPSNCIWATRTIQARNKRIIHRNKSGINGVSFCTTKGKWNASIKNNKKSINLGYYSTKDEAAKARKEGEVKYWSESNGREICI